MQHSKLDSNPLLNLLYTLTLFVFNYLVLFSLLAFPDLGLVYGRQVAIYCTYVLLNAFAYKHVFTVTSASLHVVTVKL